MFESNDNPGAVEELEALEVQELDDDSVQNSSSVDMSGMDKTSISSSIFPVLFIDKKLKVIFANLACKNLFTGFFNITGNYFFDTFGRAFDLADIKKIRETVLTGINGYSWKGNAQIKSHDMVSLQTKVYVFPTDLRSKAPDLFTVMFDDVTEENKCLLRAVFISLLEASKLKDNDTGKHIVRVNYYSKRIAQELHQNGNPIYKRIDADYIDNIGFLASMHDVGKIGTPDDILNKEGSLSDWEWAIMREHTINGGFILSSYPNPMAKDISLCHHERWNGSGYPYNLEGEMIPLSARIVAIADVYDALRMKRSYKSAMSHRDAYKKIVEESGTHFDPALIHAFRKIKDDFHGIFESNKD